LKVRSHLDHSDSAAFVVYGEEKAEACVAATKRKSIESSTQCYATVGLVVTLKPHPSLLFHRERMAAVSEPEQRCFCLPMGSSKFVHLM
jgi:hypothetical protein